MFLSDDEKSAKSSVLEELLAKMDGRTADRIRGPKKMESEGAMDDIMDKVAGAKEMPVESDEYASEEPVEGGIDEEQKRMIEELYNRYCR